MAWFTSAFGENLLVRVLDKGGQGLPPNAMSWATQDSNQCVMPANGANIQSQINVAAGQNLTVLDLRFAYTLGDVNTLFANMETAGRNLYQTMAGKIDMAYPLVYGSLLMLLFAFFLKKINRFKHPFLPLIFFPALLTFFDYLENFNTLRLLKAYPNLTAEAVSWGSFLTSLKHIFSIVCLSLLLILIVFHLLHLFKQYKASNN